MSSGDLDVSEKSENVRVVVRCRPLSRKEGERGCQEIVNVDPQLRSVAVKPPNSSAATSAEPKEGRTFTFDAVFGAEATQADVYNDVARPIIQNVLEGYNGTIFAYGQTGTGKTYTMEGEYNVPELKGIIPNSFAQIFSHIAHAEEDQRFLVRCSYLEIYNEDVRDLLAKSATAKLGVKEHKDKGVYVKELSSFVVRNEVDMDRIMEIGNRNRSVASTNMNSVSSRSHAIFTITVECGIAKPGEAKSRFRVGKLNLVDLAGSERLAKTQATGDRLKEATKINLSLSNLGNVISALVDGSSHVPYRNSKLTRLLQDSLGGNSKTVMVANVGPADYNYDETISTLRFANRAKNIKNHAIINEDPKDALLRQFERQIQELKMQLEEDLVASNVHHDHSGDSEVSEDDDESLEEVGDVGADAGSSLAGLEAMEGIKEQLQTHLQLNSCIGTEAASKHNMISALTAKVSNWKETEAQKASLKDRLESLQRKILVGGENLLVKSEAQEELLLRSMKEIKERKEEEEQLRTHLQQQEEDRKQLESRILRYQEENLTISKKLKKVWHQYQTQKNEMAQLKLEFQEESDAILEEVKKLSRELQYHNMLIDNFIPSNYQRLIEKNVKWHEESGEWSLKCIAYAGNNMTRTTVQSPPQDKGGKRGDNQSVDLSSFYLDLSDEFSFQEEESLSIAKMPQGKMQGQGSRSARPQSASHHPRPSSAFKGSSGRTPSRHLT